MGQSSASTVAWQPLKKREVRGCFDGGAITSDAGALLLGEVDEKLGIRRRFAGCFTDHRLPELIEFVTRLRRDARLYHPLTDGPKNPAGGRPRQWGRRVAARTSTARFVDFATKNTNQSVPQNVNRLSRKALPSVKYEITPMESNRRCASLPFHRVQMGQWLEEQEDEVLTEIRPEEPIPEEARVPCASMDGVNVLLSEPGKKRKWRSPTSVRTRASRENMFRRPVTKTRWSAEAVFGNGAYPTA